MKSIATLGQFDETIQYVDRLTVKVVIKKGDLILLLNDGLLPGGGIDEHESYNDAITRELQEELGVSVRSIEVVGIIIQYRNFLGKRYVIKGYSAELGSTGGKTNPQDEGEVNFKQRWLHIEDALRLVADSIAVAKMKPMNSDVNQGKLYNLMATHEFLKQIVP